MSILGVAVQWIGVQHLWGLFARLFLESVDSVVVGWIVVGRLFFGWLMLEEKLLECFCFRKSCWYFCCRKSFWSVLLLLDKLLDSFLL